MSPSAQDAARLREFQQFLDGAIHGLRAPIRGIGTSAELLSRRLGESPDEETRVPLRSILDGIAQLDRLTRALADYSAALLHGNITKQVLPVEYAVQSALAILRREVEGSAVVVYTGPMPSLEAEHGQLAILFRCLLSNALEFRSPAGQTRVEITATAAEGEWRFAISDNGIGIAARFHRQVFEPFERLHANRAGFGLGLAIAKKIVAAHGGRIWVDSREGEGSTFFFTLPRNNGT